MGFIWGKVGVGLSSIELLDEVSPVQVSLCNFPILGYLTSCHILAQTVFVYLYLTL
jgi:hypothetical protein